MIWNWTKNLWVISPSHTSLNQRELRRWKHWHHSQQQHGQQWLNSVIFSCKSCDRKERHMLFSWVYLWKYRLCRHVSHPHYRQEIKSYRASTRTVEVEFGKKIQMLMHTRWIWTNKLCFMKHLANRTPLHNPTAWDRTSLATKVRDSVSRVCDVCQL